MSNALRSFSGSTGGDWKVTNAAQTVARGANGQYANGWEVTYQLATGHVGTVFVPSPQFNEDAVRAAVAEDAARLYSVINLSSS